MLYMCSFKGTSLEVVFVLFDPSTCGFIVNTRALVLNPTSPFLGEKTKRKKTTLVSISKLNLDS